MSTILVTGGAGFIGSHLVDYLIEKNLSVVVLDKLTYAGDVQNLAIAKASGKLIFIQSDICDTNTVLDTLRKYDVMHIFHLAAESHVDNSISNPDVFINTNILGTVSILQAATTYWRETSQMENARFIHISTDEVFGHLNESDAPFHEETPYRPNSPYSASKAASDHFVRSWHMTYKLPVIITNCSNNFGSRQHKEKLIPTIIRNALDEKSIPIYGSGKNIRDWLYVKNHCEGLYLALTKGKVGQSYAFGGRNEMRNIDIAQKICDALDQKLPRKNGQSYKKLIDFVEDRQGHDWRYAVNTTKAEKELGFSPISKYSKYLLETLYFYIDKHSTEIDKIPKIVDLKTDKTIDLAKANLNYDCFRKLAQNKHISEHERIGFPNSYREDFVPYILHDISKKLDLENRSNERLLDIGCGAGSLVSGLIHLSDKFNIHTVLNDSPEMLDLIDCKNHCSLIAGKFPDTLGEALTLSPDGYDMILCYSVLHYIIIDHNIFDFIDAVCLALAPGGVALIGDIPNQSKRNRFFSSEAGISYHKNFMNTDRLPVVEHYKIRRNSIDEAVINAIIDRARAMGCNAYAVPQPDTLPMHNRRDDILIYKV